MARSTRHWLILEKVISYDDMLLRSFWMFSCKSLYPGVNIAIGGRVLNT